MSSDDDRLRRLGLDDAQRPGRAPRPEPLYLEPDGAIPNNALPALLYRSGGPGGGDLAEAFEALFGANEWPAQWRGGVFAFQHYHSTAHEALGITGGHARVQLGGPSGPVVSLAAGDVAVLPAGVGHCRIEADAAFGVVGAYPANQPDWDLCRDDPAAYDAACARIARVPLPTLDPVAGARGPLLALWS